MQLGISVCTVRIHIRNAIQKLDAINIPNAVARAYVAGILG
jgi:DNA-binding CsgD family transcriptional regulator